MSRYSDGGYGPEEPPRERSYDDPLAADALPTVDSWQDDPLPPLDPLAGPPPAADPPAADPPAGEPPLPADDLPRYPPPTPDELPGRYRPPPVPDPPRETRSPGPPPIAPALGYISGTGEDPAVQTGLGALPAFRDDVPPANGTAGAPDRDAPWLSDPAEPTVDRTAGAHGARSGSPRSAARRRRQPDRATLLRSLAVVVLTLAVVGLVGTWLRGTSAPETPVASATPVASRGISVRATRGDVEIAAGIPGRMLYKGVLRKGQVKTFTQPLLILLVNDAGVTDVFVNGRKHAPLGKNGAPARLTLRS